MGSIYAIAEMNQRAEEMIFKVRSELFRSGSAPDTFSVKRQGPFLQMTFRKETICTDPYEAWIALRKMTSGLNDAEIWARLSSVRQTEAPCTAKFKWGIGLLVVGFLTLVMSLVRASSP